MKKNIIFVMLLLFFCPAFVLAEWEVPRMLSDGIDLEDNTSYNNAWCITANNNIIHVVWTHTNPGVPPNYNPWDQIHYKRSSNGGVNWEDAMILDDISGVNYCYDPSIAVWNSQVYIVEVHDGPFPDDECISYLYSSDNGNTWGESCPIDTVASHMHGSDHPCAAIGYIPFLDYVDTLIPLGPPVNQEKKLTCHIVWDRGIDVKAPEHVYYTNLLRSNGLCLSDDLPGSGFVSIAVSGLKIHVVWYQNGIHYTRSPNGKDWQIPIKLADGIWSSIAASGPNVHVVWTDYRDGNDEIYYKRSTNGGLNWGSDIRLTSCEGFSTHPSIAALGSNVHVVWQDNRNGNYEIYYKRSTDCGATWPVSDERLTFFSVGTCKYPSIAVSGRKVHVVWTHSQDDSPGSFDNRIYYTRNPTGNPFNPVEPETLPGRAGQANPESLKASSEIFEDISKLITPNPFVSFIRVEGYEQEDFMVYDVLGRLLATDKGVRIGADLLPGVYFIKCVSKNLPSKRIIKVK